MSSHVGRIAIYEDKAKWTFYYGAVLGLGDTLDVVRGCGPQEGDRIGTVTVSSHDEAGPIFSVDSEYEEEIRRAIAEEQFSRAAPNNLTDFDVQACPGCGRPYWDHDVKRIALPGGLTAAELKAELVGLSGGPKMRKAISLGVGLEIRCRD